MKQLTVFLLTLILMLSLCSCGAKEMTGPAPTGTAEAPAQTEAPTPVPTEASTPSPIPSPTPRVIRLNPLPIGDAALERTWYLLAVNPAAVFSAPRTGGVNAAGAEAFIRYMLSESARSAALAKTDGNGEALYALPVNAVTWSQEIAPASVETRRIHLAAAGACAESGLLRELISFFERDYGYTVEILSADDAVCADTAPEGWADVLLLCSTAECDRISGCLGIPVCTGMLYSGMLVSRDVLLVPAEESERFSECGSLNDALRAIESAGLSCTDLRNVSDAAEALEEINAAGGCAICTESAYLDFSAE